MMWPEKPRCAECGGTRFTARGWAKCFQDVTRREGKWRIYPLRVYNEFDGVSAVECADCSYEVADGSAFEALQLRSDVEYADEPRRSPNRSVTGKGNSQRVHTAPIKRTLGRFPSDLLREIAEWALAEIERRR